MSSVLASEYKLKDVYFLFQMGCRLFLVSIHSEKDVFVPKRIMMSTIAKMTVADYESDCDEVGLYDWLYGRFEDDLENVDDSTLTIDIKDMDRPLIVKEK